MKKTCKLKEISILKTGPFGTQFKASEYVKKGIPVINVKNIGYGNLNYEDLDFINAETRNRLSEHVLHTGDIVFGRKGSVDRHCLITEKEDGWFQGSDCLRVRITNGNVNPQYVSYYLLSNHILKSINHAAVGSTMASINMDIIGDLQILLPSYDEQCKIANILKKLDDKRDVNNHINDNLQQMAKIIYDYWFTQFDFPDENGKPYRSSGGQMVWNEKLKREIPAGWEAIQIGDIVELLSGYPFSSDIYASQGQYRLLTIKNVQDSGVNINVDNYIDFIPRNMPEYCKLSPKDIVMSLTGNVGRIGVIFSDDCLLNQRVALIKPKTEQNRAFIYFMLKSNIIRKQMEIIANGSSQKNLSPVETGKLAIAFNADVARKFSAKINNQLVKIVENYAENQYLIQLRDWLLPMLMNGQTTVTD